MFRGLTILGTRELFEKITGTRVFRTLPRGIDLFGDIRNCLPRAKVSTVFDVGANVGQSAKEFVKNFPDSQIYCFEPVEEVYRKLQAELRSHTNVRTFQFALGARAGQRQMVLQGPPEMNFLQPEGADLSVYDEADLEQVSLQTLDDFCQKQGITHIDFLKIDTEGADLDVLKGTESMLDSQEVDIIQVEAGANWQNQRHVGFEYFSKFMAQRDYCLFGIYEQVNEWPTEAPNLRRMNPIFISDRIVKENTASLHPARLRHG
jgi:FkbM family methyltransferase